MPKALTEWKEALDRLGPYRRHPDGTLFVYSHPQDAEEGEPSGIYCPAEDVIRRRLADHFGTEGWTVSKRNAVMEYLRDRSALVFTDVQEPLVPVLNGVLNLMDPDRLELMPHNPMQAFIGQIPHDYRKDAQCLRIDAFLLEACEGDEDMVRFIYELIGYTLLPFQFLRKAVMVTGPSGTGKSTVLYLLESLLGQGNCANVPLQALGDDRFAVSDLFGKLANIGGDIDATEVKQTGMFKSLTGDDQIRADVKFGKPIRFRSGATCWFAANQVPSSRDHTDAWRDRWIILPFDHQPTKRDFTLKAKLTTPGEMQGLLRKAVEGAAAILSRGDLLIPDKVRDAHERFVVETDSVQAFLLYAEQKYGRKVGRDQLQAAYQEWALAEGLKPVRRSVLLQRAGEKWTQTDTGFNIPEGSADAG